MCCPSTITVICCYSLSTIILTTLLIVVKCIIIIIIIPDTLPVVEVANLVFDSRKTYYNRNNSVVELYLCFLFFFHVNNNNKLLYKAKNKGRVWKTLLQSSIYVLSVSQVLFFNDDMAECTFNNATRKYLHFGTRGNFTSS